MAMRAFWTKREMTMTIFFMGVTSYMLTASIVEWCEKRGEEEGGQMNRRREKVGAHFHLLFLVLHASMAEEVKKANAEQGEILRRVQGTPAAFPAPPALSPNPTRQPQPIQR